MRGERANRQVRSNGSDWSVDRADRAMGCERANRQVRHCRADRQMQRADGQMRLKATARAAGLTRCGIGLRRQIGAKRNVQALAKCVATGPDRLVSGPGREMQGARREVAARTGRQMDRSDWRVGERNGDLVQLRVRQDRTVDRTNRLMTTGSRREVERADLAMQVRTEGQME